MFRISCEEMHADGVKARGDLRVTDAFAQHMPDLHAAMFYGTNWRESQTAPFLMWFDADSGDARVDFSLWTTGFFDIVNILMDANIVRRYDFPSAENVKQSLRHKINAWGFVFSAVDNNGLLTIQLRRADSCCDFRLNRASWQTFPWVRCRAGDKLIGGV